MRAAAQFARNLTAKLCSVLAIQTLTDVVVQRPSFSYDWLWTILSEAYSELCQTFKMGRIANVAVIWNPLSIFTKSFILDVWMSSEYVSVYYNVCFYLDTFISLSCITLFTRVDS